MNIDQIHVCCGIFDFLFVQIPSQRSYYVYIEILYAVIYFVKMSNIGLLKDILAIIIIMIIIIIYFCKIASILVDIKIIM